MNENPIIPTPHTYSSSKLIEICCKCGFVHRDDRIKRPMNKQKKIHYYWLPNKGEVVKNTFTLHATVCVSCVDIDNSVNWKVYNEQRKKTPIQYYMKFSYNALLPEHLHPWKFKMEQIIHKNSRSIKSVLMVEFF